MSRALEQKTNAFGFPKPGELIEMTGTHALEASDRAILNLLYQHAHDSGRLPEPGAKWEISLSVVREAFSKHENNDRLKNSLKRLKAIVVSVAYVDEGGEPRITYTGLFDFFDISANALARRGTLRYGLPSQLGEILVRSGKWGRIKAEIVCAMTSKYAIALYELVQLRANLQRCTETFAVDRFRELLGVPPGSYTRTDNFMRKVVEPALLEINGLSDLAVQIKMERRHSRASIDAVSIGWGPKAVDEFRAAQQERNRSKVGRMARLRGQVEKTEVSLGKIPGVSDDVAEALRQLRTAAE